MKRIFSYNKFGEEKLDTLVETFNVLVQKSIENKNNTPEYKEANAKFNESLVAECVNAIPNTTFSSIEQVKAPMINTDVFFLQRFNTILAQAITPASPTIAASGYEQLYDVMQTGWGDNAKYLVESNEMFIVNDMAEGIARGGVQTMYNTEYTVQASRRQVSVYVDWYHVAAGKQDWGRFGQKVGDAFVSWIQAKTAKAMASVITDATQHGISGYIANGMSDNNWLTTARNVRLANGNADVYALGTNIALADVLPDMSATPGSQFRYDENSQIVKTGYLPAYKNVPMVELGNALIPNTINGKPEVVVPDDIIYFIPMGWNKPVKVVFEGNTVTVTKDPLTSTDHTYGMTVDMRIGVDVVVGAKFGAIQLA